mmetsp:Transcript_9315/g.14089  ORF Transcript_9315/g.14089 Transcript_9315/m.14089 type:complete len:125 (-) Transcript_9315:43-417(-)
MDSMHPESTPIDFFEPNERLYPFTKTVSFINATLEAGDCMYVPAFYYVQSRTLEAEGVDGEPETIMINQKFAAHSQLVDIIMHALPTLTDDQENSYDKKLKNYLGLGSWMDDSSKSASKNSGKE